MFCQQREPNPHFLPRHNNDDPVIEFPSQQTRPPPHHPGPTSIEPPYAPRPQPPPQHPQPQLKRQPPHPVGPPPHPHQESNPHLTPGRDTRPLSSQPSGRAHLTPDHDTRPLSSQPSGRAHHHRHGSLFVRGPTSRRTKPLTWLVAAFCALFWILIIVGGLIILIVYLVFQPRNPRFDISTATLNAAYLDMGYLLNADVTLLANFTNPNTKVNVEFSYVVLDLYYSRNLIATYYISPFSVVKRESRFANVHLVASQVRLSTGLSVELQRRMDNGSVNFEIRGLFRTRSRLGGVFRYSYWLYAHCEIETCGPPAGVLIGKRCVTRR